MPIYQRRRLSDYKSGYISTDPSARLSYNGISHHEKFFFDDFSIYAGTDHSQTSAPGILATRTASPARSNDAPPTSGPSKYSN
ncbi:MAG TPA: hypothetical protein DCM07_28785 [Planctomycetaceae bacterium]|nr:hypothetical protein [Planctomycetaceae bacterium]